MSKVKNLKKYIQYNFVKIISNLKKKKIRLNMFYQSRIIQNSKHFVYQHCTNMYVVIK